VRLGKEREGLLEDLGKSLDRSGLMRLAEASVKYRTGAMGGLEYYGLLKGLGESQGRELKEIGKYVEYLGKLGSVDMGKAVEGLWATRERRG
jgi:hypothetical protein